MAGPLQRWQLAGWLLLLLAGAGFVIGIVSREASAGLPLASLVVALWAGMLIAVAYCFAAPLPSSSPESPLLTRVGRRIKLGLLWLLACATILLFGLVAIITIRAIGLLIDRL